MLTSFYFVSSRAEHYFENVAFLEDMIETAIPKPQNTENSRFSLPLKESIKFAYEQPHDYRKVFHPVKNRVLEWQQLECFSSACHQDSFIMFIGGSLSVMEWVPFPYSYDGNEMLAICCSCDPNSATSVRGATDPVKYVIQIWSIPSNDKDEENQAINTETPQLVYVIECNDGPILSMKFCPSGGYIPEKRLGLLAVTAFDGTVDILALPPVDKYQPDDQTDTGLRTIEKSPVISLRCSLNDDFKTTSSRISWSQVNTISNYIRD